MSKAGPVAREVLDAAQEQAQQRVLQTGGQADEILLEANEQLVLALMRCRDDAERSARERVQLEAQINLDGLTALPNRLLLLDRFAVAAANARRNDHRMALLFLDIDRFKRVNDRLGHAAGDALLQHVAHCLQRCVRAADTVSRHGGDEFLLLLSPIQTPADALRVGQEVLRALAEPFRHEGQQLRMAASIGISIYPDDAADANTLIALADAAMYQAKQQPRCKVMFHANPPEAAMAQTLPEVTRQQEQVTLASALSAHELHFQELREANEQLLLAALDARELLHAAEASQVRQRQFLAVIAHELRHPLAPIRTAAAVLGHLSPGEPVLTQVQGIIERQVAHMARLVGDLLDVSRVELGKLRLECEVLDMSDVLLQAAEAARPTLSAHRQRFHFQAPVRPILLNGDPDRLMQVLQNLLQNASKYTQDGGDIRMDVAIHGQRLEVDISDNGIGISAEALQDVFKPFVQEADAIGFNGAGLGIGLTVVQQLVEAHGGSVQAFSGGRGKGSRFHLVLPMLPPVIATPA